jgi:hypothetical protein
MFEFIIESFLGFVIECFVALVLWVILFPVVWLVSLPFILVMALFRRQPYGYAVANMLMAVHLFWREAGAYFTSAV